MNDDFNMEDELANSIAQIIDEETSEAEDMYRDKLDNKANKTEPVDEDDDDYEDDDNNNNKRKLFIIIGAVAVSVILIVTAIVFYSNPLLIRVRTITDITRTSHTRRKIPIKIMTKQ